MRIKKSDIIILIIILIFFISFIKIKIFSQKSEAILLDYSSNKLTNIINNIINETLNEKKYSYKYDDIIIVEKDKNDNISSLDFKNDLVNTILYNVTNEILGNIKQIEKNNFEELDIKHISFYDKVYYIPYGVVYNNNILNSLGPKIPFKISLVGSTNNEISVNVQEYGINSSKVEIVLIIFLKIQILLPFKSKIIDIKKNVILDSKIIQGKVPDYYGGLFSMN